MRLWGATPWGSRRLCVAAPTGRIGVRASRAAALASASVLLACLSAPARAEPPDRSQKVAQQLAQAWTTQRVASRLKHNQETLIVATSRPETSYLAIAGDLAAAVDADSGVRILPMATEGGLASLQDLLLLRGVDLAIVAANVLAHAKATNALGGSLPQRLTYVAPLYGEEVHVVVGPRITAVSELRGKRIAIPPGDGTVHFTAKDIFQRLGVAFEEVQMEPAEAVREVRSGTVAAALLLAGKPVPLVASLPKDGRLRLLSLSLPKPPGEGEGYSPAVLLADDYPALIPPGAIVETIAVGAVLVANKEIDEAARRVAKHAPVVLDALARLAVSQRHPKWRDVNLGAVLPGWARVPAADAWLARASQQRREALQSQFEEFLRAEKQLTSSELANPEKKKLFDEFQSWARKSVTNERTTK